MEFRNRLIKYSEKIAFWENNVFKHYYFSIIIMLFSKYNNIIYIYIYIYIIEDLIK